MGELRGGGGGGGGEMEKLVLLNSSKGTLNLISDWSQEGQKLTGNEVGVMLWLLFGTRSMTLWNFFVCKLSTLEADN